MGCDDPTQSESLDMSPNAVDMTPGLDVLPMPLDISPEPVDAGPTDVAQPDMYIETGCTHCHRPEGSGIEEAHPFGQVSLSCVDCHGGNPDEFDDPNRAHPALPAEVPENLPPSCEDPNLDRFAGQSCEHRSECNGASASACDRETGRCRPCQESPCAHWLTCSDSGVCCLDYRGIRRLSTDQIDALPEEVIQFVNPGDHRVAHMGCGSGNPQAGGTGCHQDVVEATRLSVMETFNGHYNLSRYLAGMQDRTAEVGVVDRVSPILPDEPDDPLRTEEIRTLRGASVTPEEAFVPAAMDTYLVQNCPYCHTASFGRNDDLRNYRSSGCTACHMLYAEDGLSESMNPHVDPNEPGHPIRHELTTQIPTSQCEHCHFQGARIGLTYQGIREGKFNEPPEVKAGHTPWKPTGVHGNPDGAYYEKKTMTHGMRKPCPTFIAVPLENQEMIAKWTAWIVTRHKLFTVTAKCIPQQGSSGHSVYGLPRNRPPAIEADAEGVYRTATERR